MKKLTRNKDLRIRVNEDEYKIIQNNAKLYGFSRMSDFMRYRAMECVSEEIPMRNVCQANELLQMIRTRHSNCEQTQEDVGKVYNLINRWRC